MENRISMAELIQTKMLLTDYKAVSQTSLKVMSAIKNEDVENQVLGIAAALLTVLDRYGLNYIDVLGEADSIVFSGENNNMISEFKELQGMMKTKKEIE